MDFYLFVEGPLLWLAVLTFVIGTLLRAATFIALSAKKDKVIYQHFRWKYVLATWVRWLLPANPTVLKPVTSTGFGLSVVVPLPSSPWLLDPQHFTPPFLIAQVWERPTEIALTDESFADWSF